MGAFFDTGHDSRKILYKNYSEMSMTNTGEYVMIVL